MSFDPAQLGGVHLVPLTAFDASNKINTDVQAGHIGAMYDAGVRIFLPAAGTSEFQSLSADEVIQLVEINREHSGPDALIFAPVGLQVGHAEDIGRRATAAGAVKN